MIIYRPKLKPTNLCKLCNLRYLKSEEECTHCKDLNGHQLIALKEKTRIKKENNKSLGILFFMVATILGVFLLLS